MRYPTRPKRMLSHESSKKGVRLSATAQAAEIAIPTSIRWYLMCVCVGGGGGVFGFVSEVRCIESVLASIRSKTKKTW
jgi:hypothetical protein